MNDIVWHNEKRALKDLKPYSKNPRKLSKKQYGELRASIEKFGLAEIPAVNTNGFIAAGHQRFKILSDLYGLDHEIDVRIPNRELTEKEFDEYLIRSNKNGGEFDFLMLEDNFEIDDLIEFGFDKDEFSFSMEAEDVDVEDKELKDLSDELEEQIKVEISCVDEVEAESLYMELTERGLQCKILSL